MSRTFQKGKMFFFVGERINGGKNPRMHAGAVKNSTIRNVINNILRLNNNDEKTVFIR